MMPHCGIARRLAGLERSALAYACNATLGLLVYPTVNVGGTETPRTAHSKGRELTRRGKPIDRSLI